MANQKVIGGGVRGKDILTIQVPIKPAETFVSGDMLVLTSTGAALPVAAGNDYANPSTNAVRILGRAESPAVDPNTNTINPFVAVTVARPGTQFSLPLYSATAASAVPTITQIGTAYVLRNVTAWSGPGVNVDNTTNPHLYVVDFDPSDFSAWPTSVGPGSTQFANVWVEFKAGASLMTGAR